MPRPRDPQRTPNAAESTISAAKEVERPTAYRVVISPTVLELSAHLATAEELKSLVKLLRASAVIWGKTEITEAQKRPSLEIPEDDLHALRDIWQRLDSTASKPFPR
jgi:hypothetical protein